MFSDIGNVKFKTVPLGMFCDTCWLIDIPVISPCAFVVMLDTTVNDGIPGVCESILAPTTILPVGFVTKKLVAPTGTVAWLVSAWPLIPPVPASKLNCSFVG